VKVDELNIDAITSPEHPDQSEVRRYICDDCGFYRVDCVFSRRCDLETRSSPLPREQDCTVDKWCLNIGTEFRDADFTQAARNYVLRHHAATIPDRDEARRGIAGDRCCGRPDRVGIRDLG
jgi:hypothetical protein